MGNMYCQPLGNPGKINLPIENAGLIPKLQASDITPGSPQMNSAGMSIKVNGVSRVLTEGQTYTVSSGKDPLSGLLIL